MSLKMTQHNIYSYTFIVGPPGTGKTYVGLKIAESILYNLYGVPGNGSELSDGK